MLQRIEKVGAVAHTIKTVTAGIDNRPLHRIAKLDRLLAVGEQDCFLDHTCLGARTQKNRHVPLSLLVGAVLKITKHLLVQAQTTRPFLDADQRIAGLKNPRVHQRSHRLFCRLFESVPQIGGLGVGISMPAQIEPNAVAKRFVRPRYCSSMRSTDAPFS